MPLTPAVCWACRLRLFATLHGARSAGHVIQRTPPFKIPHRTFVITPPRKHQSDSTPLNSGLSTDPRPAEADDEVASSDRLKEAELEYSEELVEDAAAEGGAEQTSGLDSLEALRRETAWRDPELVAKAAREAFRDRLPEGALSPEQYKVYERLYGTPQPFVEEYGLPEQEEVEDDGNVLLRESEDGMLEEVELIEDEEMLDGDMAAIERLEEAGAMDTRRQRSRNRSHADDQLAKDILASVQAANAERTVYSPDDQGHSDGEHVPETDAGEQDSTDLDSTTRAHPFTLAYRSGTSPSTLPLPRAALTEPVAMLLSNASNKHLDETAHRLFGGPGLPYSPLTPLSSRNLPQKPIPISAGQGRMGSMEADVFMAAVMPSTYAAVMSALTEVRRRLGAPWLETLLKKQGGPRILDAGAGGAGVLAWREVLKAEWYRMHDRSASSSSSPTATPNVADTSATSDQQPDFDMPPVPLGKATVLTGSTALRQRASVLLENTTFLPRLPDYVHAQFPSEDSQRKQFDIIVAPHSLWHLKENYERKQFVTNLWNLLDPNGGIVLLLEKGVPRGFEVVAEARGYLLNELISGREQQDPIKEDGDPAEEPLSDQQRRRTSSTRLPRRAPGRIVAPCPHHSKCPLYLVPGLSKQRKDYCHFSQRYVRPPYLQRMLGAKNRNYDTIDFSYVAVQKGVSHDTNMNHTRPTEPTLRGVEATERAFEGYDLTDEDTSPSPPHIPNPLPRVLLPPLKRQGHVILDLCLPSGKLERWTVPRSFGKQPYRDARKAQWGDLWPLGAKHREQKRVRLGLKHMEQGIGTGRGAEGTAAAAVEDGEEAESDVAASAGMVEDGSFGYGQSKVRRGAAGKLRVDRGRLKARRRKREEKEALLHGGDED